MKRNISIQLKAALLLVVFALNTLVGFACAVGVDMSFNTSHHEDEEPAIAVHVHAGGKKNHHEEAEHKHKHNDKKGGCCNDKVIKIYQTDKSVPQASSLISPVFFTAFVSTYFTTDIVCYSQISSNTRYFVRSYHPPIPDIRIAIQSFQI
jgi:hypothetical protein